MDILYKKGEENKLAINKKEAFCQLIDQPFPPVGKLFSVIISEMDENIRKLKRQSTVYSTLPDITREALANCHGDWYEWLLAIISINTYLSKDTSYIALILPNVRQFNVSELYVTDIQEIINDLKNKVKSSADVEFITSNPDFVIIDMTNIDVSFPFVTPISHVTPDIIETIETLYTHFISKCCLDDIIGYISAKTSLRPDRRLQIAHEGSLMKAVYAHLQTRLWLLDPKGLNYYAFSTKIRDSDRTALKTIATHSLITVNTKPQAAVDEVFEVNSIVKAEQAFLTILKS